MTGRVLVVDDVGVNRLVLRAMLSGGPWELRFAENGAEAVAAFEEDSSDLVLMDIAMPVMDGIAAARAMRAIEAGRAWARTGIVAVTASFDRATHVAALDAGFDEVVTKPVAKAAILATAHERVRNRTRPPR